MALEKSSRSKRKRGFKTEGPHKKTKELSSSAQRRALKHERQATRPHAEVVSEAKEVWNKLRLKDNTEKESRNLVEELMGLIRGRIHEVALQHDASRVVQAAIQFGNKAERQEVVQELCSKGNLPEFAKSQYSHFLVLKIIKYCAQDTVCVELLCKALKGHIPKLAVHAVAGRVLQLLMCTFDDKQTHTLKLEFYGPYISLFARVPTKAKPSLQRCLEQLPEKRSSTLQFVLSILNKGIEKGLLGFAYLQQLFAEYVQAVPSNEVRAIAPSVVDHSIHLLSTRPGATVVAALASYGTAKDRKRIMKSLKGYTKSSLLHRDAYLPILRLVTVTDDTVTLYKSVLAELLSNAEIEEDQYKSPLLDIATDENASKLFLVLLSNNDEAAKRYLDPITELPLLKPNPTVVQDGEEVPTSKKNPSTRRKELLHHLEKPLIDLCSKHANQLLRSTPGSRVIKEVYSSFRSARVVDAVVAECIVGVSGVEGTSRSLFEDRTAHGALKQLILCDVAGEDVANFSTAFASELKGKLHKVATSNRGCFVVASLLEVPCVRDGVLAELSEHKKSITKASEHSPVKAGFDAVLKAVSK